MRIMNSTCFIFTIHFVVVIKGAFLRATRRDRNPNLNVAIEHARHVCRLILARFVWTSTKNELNE